MRNCSLLVGTFLFVPAPHSVHRVKKAKLNTEQRCGRSPFQSRCGTSLIVPCDREALKKCLTGRMASKNRRSTSPS